MLTVRAWVSCGWTSRQIDKKKQQQQQRTNKHISLITLSSLYPKTKSQNRVKVFLVFIIIFYIRAIAGDPFQKTEPPPGFAVGMLGSPKTKFQGKLYGLHCLLSRSKKHVFFFFLLTKLCQQCRPPIEAQKCPALSRETLSKNIFCG